MPDRVNGALPRRMLLLFLGAAFIAVLSLPFLYHPAPPVQGPVTPAKVPGPLAGAILVFSFAMLEVSESLILAVKEQYFPITKAIYQLLGRIEDGAFIASALGVWSMALLAIALLIAGLLLGRRMGQLFRV